jgi:quercetin dioxygenase-like cupin family protein
MAENTIIRRQLLTADTGTRTLTSVQAHEIHFAPGQKGGLHLHPCPVAGYVIEGTAMLQVEGEEEQVLPAGSAFFEPADARILHFDNHSDKEPMVFVAFYLLNGEQKLIEMPEG